MCGICGFVGFSDRELLKKMTDALRHRGPDSEGFHIEPGINLGVRRLRVIDLDTGDQPIYNEDKTLCIVYNGEVYNFQELKNQLQARGHVFYTNSDTEVIVHLYEDYGKNCLEYLDGMFAFAIWDKLKQELFIARDRLGVKPLYYAYSGGSLRFASELKALIQDRSISRDINSNALGYYFSFLYIPCPLSIFKAINKLPPAHTLSFKNGKLTIEKYWDLDFKDKDAHLNGCDKQELLSRLEDVVKKRLISDVPLGVFLSGGIDSSTIVAMMRRVHTGKIKTFSIGYGQKDKSYNELDRAQIIADYFQTEHRTFIVEPNIVELLPKVVWHLDEPFADSSSVLNFLISQKTKEEATVALCGIGGDELFGGYPRYIGAQLSLQYRRLPRSLRRMIAAFDFLIRDNLKSKNIGGWAKRFLSGGLLNDEECYISWMQFFKSEELNKLFDEKITGQLSGFDAYATHKKYFSESGAKDYLDKIFSVDLHTYLTDDLLHLGDRMSMAHGLELRVPFCDYRLIEYSARLPFSLKIKGRHLKAILKEALKGVVPDSILHKPKQGFMVPLGRWIKEDLKEYILDALSAAEIKRNGYLNPAAVKSILDEHFKGKRSHAHQIWALLVFMLWHDAYCR